MRKILLVLLSMAWIGSQAQTVEEVIQKYSEAMGGLEAFKKVQTVKMTGVANAQGSDFPLTLQIINGRAMRTDVDVMGQAVINVYKDGKGWKINPFAGIETATDVEGNELNDFKSQANLASGLMDYKAQGNQVELLGQEKVDGIGTYKIKLTNKIDGRVTTFYINAGNYLMVKAVSEREVMGQPAEVETAFSDVKEFGGIKFYMTRIQSVSGTVFQTISLTNVELNIPIDEKIFDK